MNEINSVILSEYNVTNAYSIFKNNSIYTFICSNEELIIENIKKLLKNKLPVYMIPSKIIQIETIPLKANGKINEEELNNLLRADKEYDADGVAKIILNKYNTEYEDCTIEMLSIDSLETLKLLQILCEKIKHNQSEFYNELLKSIVTMKISEIREYIEKWGKI